MNPVGTAQSRAGDEMSPNALHITTLDPIPDQPSLFIHSLTTGKAEQPSLPQKSSGI